MIYFELQADTFKQVLDHHMLKLGLTLTHEIKSEITKDCMCFVHDATTTNKLPSVKEFFFFYGEEKRHVRVEVDNYIFSGVIDLSFYHRREEEVYGEKLFSHKVFEDGVLLTTPERITHDLSKVYYTLDKWGVQVAVFDAIDNGSASFPNHLDKPVELTYDGQMFQIKDESTKTVRLHFLPREYSLIGIAPTLRQYVNLTKNYPANDKKLHRHRAIDPNDLIDMLNDMYHYFDINQLDGLTLLKGVLDNNTSKFDKVSATVSNTSYPAVEILKEGYNPRRKFTRYTLTKAIINDLLSR